MMHDVSRHSLTFYIVITPLPIDLRTSAIDRIVIINIIIWQSTQKQYKLEESGNVTRKNVYIIFFFFNFTYISPLVSDRLREDL